MFCRACGTANVSEANFCTNCGELLVQPTPREFRQAATQVSRCTAVVVMIPAGFIVGGNVALMMVYLWYRYFEPSAFIGVVFLVTGIAIAAWILTASLSTGRAAVLASQQ